MKKIELFIITMLFVISYAYADGYRTDEDHWEKVRQLDEMAERFKAETGFTGNINYGYERMRLGSFEGNFSDIQFSADEDTIAFRQACERIVEKILPLSPANRMQLSMSRISKSVSGFTTDYIQQVGGYRVEGSGFIVITYEEGRKRFSIGDNTVDLPGNNPTPVLTYEEAVRIYDEHIEDDEATKNFRKRRPFLSLLFSNIYGDDEINAKPDYRLCWVGGYTKCIYIDAVTGQIYKMVDYTLDDIHIHVSTQAMLSSDNTGSLTPSIVPLDSTMVIAVVDSVPDIYYTDISGEYDFQGNTISGIESFLISSCGIEVQDNTGNQIKSNSPESVLPNVVFSYDETFGNPGNLYYHAKEFRNKIKVTTALSAGCYYDSTLWEPIIRANFLLSAGVNGSYTPTPNNPGLIKITKNNGNYSSTLCHEMTHDMVYRSLRNNLFRLGSTQETRGAMDEAFSSYFPCVYRNNSIYRSEYYTKDLQNSLLTVSNVESSSYPLLPVNEELYGYYHMRFPLASAWWALRSDLHFGSTAVDTLLIAGLGIVGRDINYNAAYRYKPRYFYNILMRSVDTDNKSWPFNPKQAAIDNMYSDRGFHFYPKVQSVASADVTTPLGRESYNVLDSVYVHISNYPQNTYVQVFVVEDRDYLNVGDNGIAIPAPYEVDGNPVSGIFKTDGNGKWAGGIPFSRLLPQGDYDIIVNNMVNPTAPNNNPTDPDNTLHLAFKNDYIIDGVDGLDGPGFTKTGTGDIVVALDFSSSMSGYGAQLAQMVKALEQSMIDSERINVFGFTEGTASQGWIEDGITDLIGDDSSFLEVTQIESTNITCDNNLLIWRKNI